MWEPAHPHTHRRPQGMCINTPPIDYTPQLLAMVTHMPSDCQRFQNSHGYQKIVFKASFVSTHASLFDAFLLLQLIVLAQ